MTHLEALGVTEATALHGLHLGILVLALMVTMVGGRIIPSFTANALRRAGVARLPQSFAALEAASVASVALAAAIATVDDGGFWFGAAALAAAAANAVRLAFWRPLATCGDPLLWVLHLGYAWLVAGLALSGAAGVAELVPPTAGLHALTVGGIATMLLAVMSRASLGHTGRPLVAPPAAVAAYALVSAAALLRILAAVAGGGALPLLVVSGLCFGAGFAAFLAVYAGPLLLARPDGKPG
jgi:uncharacterized protein involved in response to NO